jgi:hypothetical protein
MMVDHVASKNRNNQGEGHMAQNHYVTKTKRRNKNSKRKDPSAKTMAALRKHAAAEAKTTSTPAK